MKQQQRHNGTFWATAAEQNDHSFFAQQSESLKYIDIGLPTLHEFWTIKILEFQYRIRVNAAPGFYFSIWVFGWGSIQMIPQKVDFLTKKWGFIQEKTQKLDFSDYLGLYSRVGQH